MTWSWDSRNLTSGFDPADVARIHADLDCLVTPSIWPENSPVSILESLALGTPVICADGEGMTNLVKDGHNGLVFKSRDSADLAAKIRLLAEEISHERAQSSQTGETATPLNPSSSSLRALRGLRGESCSSFSLHPSSFILSSISQDAADFEAIYRAARPASDPQWLAESHAFVEELRLAEA